jgi:hypothetical protein
VQSAASWKPLVPKSNVRNLIIAQFDNLEIISQIVSSVQSLKHLGLHHSSSKIMGSSSASWYTIAQGLLTHKDTLESLEIRHDGYVDFRSWGTFHDFSKLGALTLNLVYTDSKRLEESILAEMLPEGLRELTVSVCLHSLYMERVNGYFEEFLGLKEHSHLKFVKINLIGNALISPTGLRLSTVVDTLQKSGIRVQVWQSRYRNLDPVVSSLQDWEDQIEAEKRPDACVWDEESEDNNMSQSMTQSETGSEED